MDSRRERPYRLSRLMVWTFAMLLLVQGGGWGQGVPVPAGPGVDGALTGETRMFPLAEVRRGLKGVAYTVFEGVKPERMEVEILGVLKDSLGPGRDMILARLGGMKPEFTGVVAGMSGSPVYIDGRLVGALSYRIGQFSKEPIAGITPIGQMLEVRDGVATPSAAPRQVAGAVAAQAGGQSAGGLGMQAMETPVVFGGFSQEAVERFGDRFRAMGMTPVAGLGGMDGTVRQPEPLVPGSAVSAVLVEGDLSITGTCTVTYVDATRLLACGHPITQTGAVDMPMTKAEVVATVPSPLNAFKIVNATEEVGAFTEDRASALLGRFGARARMIPVEVEVATGGTGKARTFHLRVVDNRDLTPQAMLVSVYQTMQQTNTAGAETSWRMSGEIGVARRVSDGREGAALPAVRMRGMMAPTDFNSGAINVALYVGDRFSRVYSNSLEPPVVTGVKLRLEAIGQRRIAVLDSARLSRAEAKAGETVEVEAVLRPYAQAPRVVRMGFAVPASAGPGLMRVLVSDAASLDRLTAPTAGASRSVSLADAVAQADRMHANDRLYVTLLDHTAQAVLDSGALEAVPLSMANVLEPLKDAQKLRLTGESVIEAASVEVGDAVSGSEVLTLTVR